MSATQVLDSHALLALLRDEPAAEAVAKILDKGDRTVLNLCLQYGRGEPGGIRAAKIGGTWRIKPEDLEDYVQSFYPTRRNKKKETL